MTELSTELRATIESARRRFDELPEGGAARTTWELTLREHTQEAPTRDAVQIVVRVPPDLRDQVHRAAARSGAPTMQAWLNAVIARAVADELDASRRLSRRLRDGLVDELRAAIDAGWYDALVAEIAADDPDLA